MRVSQNATQPRLLGQHDVCEPPEVWRSDVVTVLRRESAANANRARNRAAGCSKLCFDARIARMYGVKRF